MLGIRRIRRRVVLVRKLRMNFASHITDNASMIFRCSRYPFTLTVGDAQEITKDQMRENLKQGCVK